MFNGGAAGAQAPQPIGRSEQCLAPASKVEAEALAASRGIGIEARPGDSGHPTAFDKEPCKGYVVRETEPTDVGHHVVRTSRYKRPEPGASQGGEKQISALLVCLFEPRVIAIRQGQRHRCRLLEGSRSPHRQEVVNFPDGG
jgi:hypothetical protein